MPFQILEALDAREIVPGFLGRFINTDQMTFSYWVVQEGATLPPHAHPHEQITTVVQGRFEMTVGGETRQLEPGMVAVIPGGVTHTGRALTPCRLIDVFQPPRDDYR